MRFSVFLAVWTLSSACFVGACAPTLSLPPSANPGDTVSVSATGLAPNAPIFFFLSRLTLSPLVRQLMEADGSGNANFDIEIPSNAPAANYTASVSCKCDGETAFATAILQVAPPSESDFEIPTESEEEDLVDALKPADDDGCSTPSVALSAAVAQAGKIVTAQISNLPASAPFVLRVARPRLAPLLTVPGTADAQGTAKLALDIPSSAPADQYTVGVTVTCSDGSSATGTAPLTIQAAPKIAQFPGLTKSGCPTPVVTLSPSAAPPGGSVSLTVTSLPSGGDVTIRVSKTGLSPLLNLKASADSSGALTVPLNLPSSTPTGSYGVTVFTTCGDSPLVATAQLSVQSARFPRLFFGH
jgi:methionine-rich copper-binding protein CopC